MTLYLTTKKIMLNVCKNMQFSLNVRVFIKISRHGHQLLEIIALHFNSASVG